MEELERSTSRGRFLRQLGITVAAGTGALAFTQRSRAVVNNCCPDVNGRCNNSNCPSGQVHFFCDCSPGGLQSYCTSDCVLPGSGCHNGPC